MKLDEGLRNSLASMGTLEKRIKATKSLYTMSEMVIITKKLLNEWEQEKEIQCHHCYLLKFWTKSWRNWQHKTTEMG